MTDSAFPNKQGLYDPAFEHDACGIGVIANIKGVSSHDIVTQALETLCRLTHRGGQGADPASGDGAGILTQIPHKLLLRESSRAGWKLPEAGRYGAGMIFLPSEDKARRECEQGLERIAEEEGYQVLGWRTVPTKDAVLGPTAANSKPYIRQWLITPEQGMEIGEGALERGLYVIRKRAEREIGLAQAKAGRTFYFASLSSRTMVYKGLLLPEQLPAFYTDLQDADYESALALVHSRFSTNTFPSWERAHPNRYMIHNGEINTIKGNVNWMLAREAACSGGPFADLSQIRPVIDLSGSDSSMLDNALEFLHLSGRSLVHSVMMMVPEPWSKDAGMEEGKRAFYEYHSCLMEPWDGPAALAFTDGKQIGACLDRNGLRPTRYYVTRDDRIILSSEVGVVDVPPDNILYKERLHPGQMLLVDLEQGRIVPDEEIKRSVSSEQPYRQWLDEHLLDLGQLPDAEGEPSGESGPASDPARLQHAFGYTFEEIAKGLRPLLLKGEDPVGSMGYDAPLAALSTKPQLLYSYFKQMFAQVTNPPIDAFLEEMITSVEVTIGAEGDLLQPGPDSCRRIRLKAPVLSNEELGRIRSSKLPGLRADTLSMTFVVGEGERGLEEALKTLFQSAEAAIDEGASLLILSDRGIGRGQAPIPALLAVSGLHHHLIRSGKRTKASLLVESGEPRDVHHIALLLGYGASAVNPYLVFDTAAQLISRGQLEELSLEQAVRNYIAGIKKGLLKVMAKMGISTVQSYIGAQIFEALGIHGDVIDTYFPRTPSRIGGIGLAEIAEEALMRHRRAYRSERPEPLQPGDEFQWRPGGEEHLFSPQTIHALQQACRSNDYDLFRKYSAGIDQHAKAHCTLRGLLELVPGRKPVPIEEVEPVEAIVARFKTGAMSLGSISKEAHEAMAIAMNRIGGRSNSGEGGEDPGRYVTDENGDHRVSAIKQVASGRFGVTSHYLIHADEIQIKMAQGAKPGEGGQLPAHKVYPWIAEARGSTPGVELISPPPHHDIYSIEDLAELIHDLKEANPRARINVKLVSEAGVGTIAAGVAKAGADVILISGYDGGTGAASRNSIKHAGMPWEIGLAEANQTLQLNGLRSRVRLETDGKMMNGRDVVIASLLGAQEFGFATVPLVVMGCVMMRVCHLDTCPVGIATQNPELRRTFAGDPGHLVNFMYFVAREVREWMARLGFRTMEEMVGRTDCLRINLPQDHWKVSGLDLSPLLYRVPGEPEDQHRPDGGETQPAEETAVKGDSPSQLLQSDDAADPMRLLSLCAAALDRRERIQAILPIRNTDRAAGTRLGSEVTRRYGAEGLPDGTIQLHFHGSAGQSFGAFIPRGITLTLEGDANDYVGKGLSGGKLAVYPPVQSGFAAEDNIIIGNVALYGATSGEAYIRGIAGERFCVRNSGAEVVVEGVGNHGCEYMTGGRVVVLGRVGHNFAAGMSGGVAYVWSRQMAEVEARCNLKLVELEMLADTEDEGRVRAMLEKHLRYTDSAVARRILEDWEREAKRFVRIIPKEYRRMIRTIERFRASGVSHEEAALAAFQERRKAQ